MPALHFAIKHPLSAKSVRGGGIYRSLEAAFPKTRFGLFRKDALLEVLVRGDLLQLLRTRLGKLLGDVNGDLRILCGSDTDLFYIVKTSRASDSTQLQLVIAGRGFDRDAC